MNYSDHDPGGYQSLPVPAVKVNSYENEQNYSDVEEEYEDDEVENEYHHNEGYETVEDGHHMEERESQCSDEEYADEDQNLTLRSIKADRIYSPPPRRSENGKKRSARLPEFEPPTLQLPPKNVKTIVQESPVLPGWSGQEGNVEEMCEGNDELDEEQHEEYEERHEEYEYEETPREELESHRGLRLVPPDNEDEDIVEIDATGGKTGHYITPEFIHRKQKAAVYNPHNFSHTLFTESFDIFCVLKVEIWFVCS